MSDSRTSQKAHNLARIRDNQRRSRARRKEYLHELEAKLRSYEQIGIGASAEIQNAARKVVDENRKLRVLLYERGVSEPELVGVLAGSPDQPYDHISAASRLTAMLERRITTNIISSTSSPSLPYARAASMPRHMPSVPPITIPPHRPTALSCDDSPSPGSMGSGMSTPPPAPYPTSFYTTPISPSITEIKSEEVQYDYPYEQQPYNEQPYNNSVTYASDYNYNADSLTYFSNTSCVDAANIIRTMRSDVGPELEADLGCRDPGQYCYVSNPTVFNAMDKYAQQHAAM
ncbi:hypothetical protein BDW02DRAFT_74773 [Decorospora gaudefroyi]|uniref:BZIP domain-containing protein n=1 Tax=Decorospora gaudefroyi TaxID=184978 RepID=A0A6A5K3W1_9PLEO|nr:hypothetical protein BDW02DRAFT_74773 [Decorospora gaudefroyi]